MACGAFAQGYLAQASRPGSQGVHFVLEATRAEGLIWYATGDLSNTDPGSLTGVGRQYPGDVTSFLSWSDQVGAAQPFGAPEPDPVNVSVSADGTLLLEFPGDGGSTTTISVASCGSGLLYGLADGTDTLYVLSLQDNPPANP